MKFVWLREPQLRVLFENEDVVVVDKPYGFDTHTNEARTGSGDEIPGLVEYFERQSRGGARLHVVHRLDRTTTGVLVFARTPSAAERYRSYFRTRTARKTYLFVTDRTAPSPAVCSVPIVRNGSELEASTEFEFVGDGVWRARPRTGRYHQIRVHAQALGLSLLGDQKYGGSEFPFHMLHCARLEFPDGLVLESPVPKYFADRTVRALEIDKRERLFAPGGCLRLINLDDVVLDRYNDRLLAKGETGEPFVADENGLRFEVRPAGGVGLYLDQRLQRSWVRETSRGRRVLNLFSYTGGFSVAASAGGAREVVSVDASKSMLNWSRVNHALNDLAPGPHLCRDALKFLEKCEPFDLIICDPPAFARTDGGVFKLDRELDKLLKLLFAKGREILFSVNGMKGGDLRAAIERAGAREFMSLQPSLDFAAPGETSSLKSFLIRTGISS